MVHYTNARILTVENVEHPIHILGVQAQAMVGCFWAFLAMLAINPIFAPVGALIAGFIARYFFINEIKGRPLTFGCFFLNLYKKASFLKGLFPSLNGIILSKGVYSGS
jgi:hypothetical protein